MVYTQVVLIPEIEDPETITCIESYDQSIYLGTQGGEIVHYFRADNEFIFASRQKSKKRAVKGIWLLPDIQRALVLTSSATSVFSLPEFAPCSMKSMREVNDVSYEPGKKNEITVFTKSAIRIVKIEDDGLKLVENIEYPGVLKGIRRNSFALVVSESYDLIDLDNVQKIPLFPVSSGPIEEGEEGVEPFIVPIGLDEFLLTTGTKKEEPAMGMVVNLNGDPSRGTIPWPKYPSSVAVDFPYVAATIDNKVMIHSLVDQSLVQELEVEGDVAPKVINVSHPYTRRSDEMESKLTKCLLDGSQEEKIEYLVKSSMFLYSSKVECLITSPRLLQLEDESKVDDDDLLEEMQKFDITTEQAVLEIEYLQLLIGLRSLKRGTISSLWTDGSLDPRIIVHIISPEDVSGNVKIYNGLRPMLDEIPKKVKKNYPLFKKFFKEWMTKRENESVVDKSAVFESLELAHLRIVIQSNAPREEIYAVIDNEIQESADTASKQLLDTKRYFLLSRLYQKQGKIEEVLDAWQKMLTGEWKDTEFSHGEEKMTAYLAQCQNADLVWKYGMWLIGRYDPAIKVFKSEKYDSHRVLSELKQLASDVPRREYLKYLVYDRRSDLFTADLLSYLIDDLIEKMDVEAVSKTYKDYAALEYKRSYVKYLKSLQRRDPSDLHKLRLEVLELLKTCQDYDAEALAKRMEPYPLTLELSIVRGRLGLHEMVLDTLCHELRDYESAITYCSEADGDDDHRRALFRSLFLEFVKLEKRTERIKWTRELLDKWSHYLDTDLVLQRTPDDWPVEVLSGYLERVFRKLMNEKNQSAMSKALARAENVQVSRFLQAIKEKIPEN